VEAVAVEAVAVAVVVSSYARSK